MMRLMKDPKFQNVLVTSISRKIPLLSAVRNALNRINSSAILYGGDTDKNVVGSYFVDQFWQMPTLDKLDIEEFISFCKEKKICSVIPTRDGELEYFSYYKNRLSEFEINAMISPYQSVQYCFDKLVFFQKLHENNFPVIQTTNSIEELTKENTFVVKEQFGAGGKSVGLNLPYSYAIMHAKTLEFPIFQPFIEGKEFSVDLFLDKRGKIKGAVSRTRDLVVNGESQITRTVNLPELEDLCSRMAKSLNLKGHVLFQVIIDKEQKFHVIECNCRFGGASTLSIAAGLDSFYWFLLESIGESLEHYPFIRTKKELTLIRHPQDYIF